ncbi:unnamed protein product [Tetraodon nigroviridis]|uniref:(spotted green pufferfish) hypothetical protein n=1 Tax=Tetraodon nigroviridis TaxID=99883 RepID=Q4SN24_TETNG|nr:unnamed protein product [Tetraodon nigroviridis]
MGESVEKCDEALASSLPHTAFTSSSVFSNGYAPGYAKLNRRGVSSQSPSEVVSLTFFLLLCSGPNPPILHLASPNICACDR